MKHLVFLVALIGGLSIWTQVQDKSHSAQKATIAGSYIPVDLNDCFEQIDKAWHESSKARVLAATENDLRSEAYAPISIWMRENWLLSSRRLTKYFTGLGIDHPDDMSSIILTSYHRYLHKHPIMLDEQVQQYKEYWAKAEAASKTP